MENAVEALKIAFGMMMFVLALTLSISSFSQANQAVDAITRMSDRENEYTYVEPTSGFSRVVGVETIVPTMYRAYRENIEIYFYNASGDPLIIYYETDQAGRRKKENGIEVGRNYIDLEKEGFGTEGIKSASQVANEHLDVILNGKTTTDNEFRKIIEKYKNQIYHENGFYNYLKGKNFREDLGQYEQESGAAKITKRVITYTLIN